MAMLEYKKALEIILSAAQILSTEKVELRDSLKRILATDVFHDTDMPPFNKSAMDGFACRRSEITNELEVVETIYAGKNPEKKIGENQCYKIMTGAVVPEQADCVFKKEDAEFTGSGKVICTNPSTPGNISLRGEDVSAGDKILDKSTLLTPRHLPLLAGAGITFPEVFKQPAVTIFSTGTELVEPGEKPLWFQIRNSNASQLLGQLAEIGLHAVYGGILKDETTQIQNKVEEAFYSNDVVILTGGVSVGEYDLIPEILDNLGFETLVRATAIKPGKPMTFARKENQFCFGLSGNPVSSFVQFELYVKPFLYAMMGHMFRQVVLKLPIATDYQQKKADRLNFIPANLNGEMEIVPVEFHGSAHINALSNANFLIEVPRGTTVIKKGSLVNARSI
ncbi:MAG: molybdopterin molybdotransferase MoeA [Prolixibacteraceae bacterium]|nr:molybdopterin molybdotransferase MoeA [Prolixibacteraceae bacterium]